MLKHVVMESPSVLVASFITGGALSLLEDLGWRLRFWILLIVWLMVVVLRWSLFS